MPFGFGGHWVKAQGKVVASHEIGSKALGTWRQEWVVEVYPQDGPPFRAPLKWPINDHGFWPVSVGEMVHIEYEAKSRELRWDKSDPATNLFARTPDDAKARQDQEFNNALAGRTPTPAAPGAGMGANGANGAWGAGAAGAGAAAGGLDPELQELLDLEMADARSHAQAQAPGAFPTGAPGMPGTPAPPADGLEGLSFQFDAGGQPAAGQVQHVVGAVASGQMRTIRGKSDEILASGVRGVAIVTTASPLGKTVRDINPNADPSRLNDPMWLFTLQVSVPGQPVFPAVFGHRVPLAKLALIAPSVRLAVAVNPANPNNEVAIDWDQSPLP